MPATIRERDEKSDDLDSKLPFMVNEFLLRLSTTVTQLSGNGFRERLKGTGDREAIREG